MNLKEKLIKIQIKEIQEKHQMGRFDFFNIF